ncbi:MAG: DM13 domain-containing protein [Armatimonadetes bacterium]|nr:DM13 domain-containing protein [Armatimonadota bacterium]
MSWSSRWRRLLGVAGVVILTAGGGALHPAVALGAQGDAVILAMGTFVGTDSVHRGEGKALLIRLADGRRFVRFEDFRVTNGPDLYVYLSGHRAPRNRAQLHEGAAFEVARLKGNVGNQNYELPADLDLTKFRSAVIYCKRFSVLFSTAELIFRP